MVVLTSFPPPTEGIKHQEPNTAVRVKERDLGKGTLYIAESRLSWVGDHGQGFSLEYPSISLHAVSRDLTSFPQECLYLMIDAQLDDNEKAEDSDNDDDDDEEEEEESSKVSEIRFIPDNKDVLDEMFKAMSECQALHPDPSDSLSEDEEGCYDDAEEDDGEYDVSAAEGHQGQGDGPTEAVAFRNGEQEEPMDVGQFDDADPEH